MEETEDMRMKDLSDLHCHILFGVDDGSRNLEMTRKMLVTAHEEGTRVLFATPHYHPGRGKNDLSVWKKHFQIVQQELLALDPEMLLVPGCEIFYTQDSLSLLRRGLWTMAGTKYVLVEFDVEAGFSHIRNALQELRRGGYWPILAHVERYCSIDSPEKVEELIDMGIYIQMNANTIARSRSPLKGRYIRTLLKRQYVHFIGSDAHDDKVRTTGMQECAQQVVKLCGQDYANAICRENAWKVVSGEEL